MTTVGAAVIAGVAVLLAGSLPWGALLAGLNLRMLVAVPWAIGPMAAYLWVYWRFISGAIGPRDTAAWRRANLRANPVSGDVWAMAIFTGLLGFAALLTLVAIMGRVVTLPASQPITTPAEMPVVTVFLLLVMGSVVAGVTEEAGFRGYMQGPIERKYGLAAAILANGAVFGLLHFPNHPDQVLTMLPYYIAVSAVYSSITFASNSILPALVLHTGGDVWSLTRLWATGRPEWQIAGSRPPLIWTSGVDAGFIAQVAAFVLLSAAAWWSCSQTARLTHSGQLEAA